LVETDTVKKKHWETLACQTIEQSASFLPKLETQHFAIEVLHNSGICYYKQNRKKEALFDFSAALRADENNSMV
jgi:Tfp pilus assembly protein PilF